MSLCSDLIVTWNLSDMGSRLAHWQLLGTLLHITSLFPDDVITKAEEETGHHKVKQYSSVFHRNSDWHHPYNPPAKNAPDTSRRSSPPAWKKLSHRGQSKRGQSKAPNYSLRPAQSHSSYKWQSLCSLVGLCRNDQKGRDFCGQCLASHVNCFIMNLVLFVARQQQKKGLSPIINKICETCLLCRSVVFCPICHQCQLQGHKNPQESLHPPLP